MPKNPRNKIVTEGRVTLQHPTGRFTVHVLPKRATALVSRGYRATEAASDEPTPLKRADLIARAKELGVPATGTNEALAAAIADAEDAATGDD